MRGAAGKLSLLLIYLLPPAQAQELRLAIQRDARQTVTFSVLDTGVLPGHTLIEFSTNGLWFPASITSSNSSVALAYTSPNNGAIRLFKATRGVTIAREVKASWQRLGVTNYVFHYSQPCLCAPEFMVSATVTVMSNEIVRVEHAKDARGNPIANPSLSVPPTIDELFDAWISSKPAGGYARQFQFDQNGFPTFINLDLDPRVADEELIFTIDRFTPLP